MDTNPDMVVLHATGGDWAMPVDVAALVADDALLDAIASGGQPRTELERLLITWRATGHAGPLRELVDVDTATRVIAAGRRAARSARIGTAVAWALVAVGAALLVLISGGWL